MDGQRRPSRVLVARSLAVCASATGSGVRCRSCEGVRDSCPCWPGAQVSGEDYITHLAAVASIVEAVEHTPEMLAAAWLHDVVEDTKTSIEDIRLLFGAAIANFVDQLTDVSRSFDGNRARRKGLDRAHLANASQEAQTIKLADLIDNSRSIMANDPVFADVYLREKAELLEVMTGGNPQLRDRANLLIGSFLRKRLLPRSSRLKALGVAPLRPDPSPARTCPIRAARFESSLPQSPEFRAREEYLQFRKSKARRRSVDGIANASGHDPVRAIDGETDRVPRLRGSSRLNSNPLGWAPTQLA
jgi:guanosine-3',5'-bis(diphosphate) 3'-pyrophosphohydrolase